MANGKEYTDFEKEISGDMKVTNSRLEETSRIVIRIEERIEKGLSNHSERLRRLEDQHLKVTGFSAGVAAIVSLLVSAVALMIGWRTK